MKFKTESRYLHYLLLFHFCCFLNPVSCDDTQGTITMVSVQVNAGKEEKAKFVHVCGGTLITNSVVFTGCSCITLPPKPGAEDRNLVYLMSPDQVRVSAGVSEASKSGQLRLQSALAYALNVHDLCDSTYVYNYGMVKSTTSFALENGLELSHVLSLDMANFEKNIKSMGPTDCYTEIWTSVGSNGPMPPNSEVTVPTLTSTPSTTVGAEYSEAIDEPSGDSLPEDLSGDISSDEPSGSGATSGESGDGDESGAEPSEGTRSANSTSITTAQTGATEHSAKTTVQINGSSVATVISLPHTTTTQTNEIASNTPLITFGPLKSDAVKDHTNESTFLPAIVTEEQTTSALSKNATNTTSSIHTNGTMINGTGTANETTVAPPDVVTNNESVSASNSSSSNSSASDSSASNSAASNSSSSNSSASMDAINATGIGGVSENPATENRHRRSAGSGDLKFSYEVYSNSERVKNKISKEKRQVTPVPNVVTPAGANITEGSANASITGMNETNGGNVSSLGMNGTNAGPNSNASDAAVNMTSSSNATGGDNETSGFPQTLDVANISSIVNQTESYTIIIKTQTEPNVPITSIINETEETDVPIVHKKTTSPTLMTKNVTAEVVVTTESSGFSNESEIGGISEGSEGSSWESGTDDSGELDYGSGDDRGANESSAESEEEEVIETNYTGIVPMSYTTELVPPPVPSAKPPSKQPPSSDPGPTSGSTPRGVGRLPVSILDWKECGTLVCPEPDKKCDDSSDDTKWCLTAMKDGASVCQADTGSPVYCKNALMGILSNVGLVCPKDNAHGIAVGLDQAFEYIKSMMGMPDFQKKVPPAETKERKSGTLKKHNPSTTHAIIGSIIAILLI